MRLQEVYYICKKASDAWPEASIEEKKEAGGTVYYILKNTEDIVDVLVMLSDIESFCDRIEEIRMTSARFYQIGEVATFNGTSKNVFIREYAALKISVLTVVELFDSMEYAQSPEGFDIKLPPNMSLADLGKCAKDLDTIFTQCPLLTKSEGNISLTAVDVGSIWLTFAIAGASVAILKGIAELVDKAIIVRSHYLTTKAQAEAVRGLQISNDILEQQKNFSEVFGKALLEKATAELAEKHAITDPEERSHLKHSIELLSSWMGKGMEVYAAVQAAQEVKAVFSPIKNQALPEETIKLLAESAKESED